MSKTSEKALGADPGNTGVQLYEAVGQGRSPGAGAGSEAPRSSLILQIL